MLKNIDKSYDHKILQRFVGCLNSPKHCVEMLIPAYLAATQKRDFQFSSTDKALLYKMTTGVCRLALSPKQTRPLPRVATDATLTHGAISRVTGRIAVFPFSKIRPVDMQELLMVLLCTLVIKPKVIMPDSMYVLHKHYSSLPWHFAVFAKQVPLDFVPSKFNRDIYLAGTLGTNIFFCFKV